MASIFEGYPLSVIEAMATGLPLFLSDIPSLRETAKENAQYFSLKDPSEVAEQLLQIVNNQEQLIPYSEKGKIYANDVGRKDMYLKKLTGIYNDVLETRYRRIV